MAELLKDTKKTSRDSKESPSMRSQKNQKKESKFSKLFLGMVVGGAVGSVVGVTLSDKDRRKKIKDSSLKAYQSGKDFFSSKENSSKSTSSKGSGFWHFLHKLFHGDKK
jgi:surface antigen